MKCVVFKASTSSELMNSGKCGKIKFFKGKVYKKSITIDIEEFYSVDINIMKINYL